MPSDLTEVYSGSSIAEVTLISQMLEVEGIRTRVINSALQSLAGEIPYLKVNPCIWVRADDAVRATRLIENQFLDEHDETIVRDEWVCPRCDELNGPMFDVCWNCTWERSAAD